MSLPFAPFKTPLGLDELRHRTRGLGQRHRTVLLLVDGHRPLGEVLGMAHRAGASTSHFEELMRLGLVSMPVEPAQEAAETAPDALDQPKLTSVEVEVLTDSSSPAHGDGPDTEGIQEIEPAAAIALTCDAALPPPPPPPPPPLLPPSSPPPARVAWRAFRQTPAPVADHARPRPPATEDQLRQQVRSLLVGALGAEASLFSPLTLTRIHIAQTSGDLIDLVWEIERQRHHPRRNHAQLLNLQQARELLGMGNTLIAGDSQTGAVWPDTQGR